MATVSKLPTWIWYVAGVLVFVVAYLYLQSSKQTPTATVTSANDLANYGGITDFLTQILQQQKGEMDQLGGGAPPTSKHPLPPSPLPSSLHKIGPVYDSKGNIIGMLGG